MAGLVPAMTTGRTRASDHRDDRDNGGPCIRKYHPNYYAAFALDPDGNNIEAVFSPGGTLRKVSYRCTQSLTLLPKWLMTC